MTRAPEQTVDSPPPGDDAHDDDDDRGLEFSGRTVLTLCGFLARDDPRRSTCCCRSSPAWRTRGAGSRTARRAGSCSPSCSRFGMFGGYVAMFRGVFGHVRPDRLARELPDHDGRARGVADLRRGRRRRARPAGLGAAPGRAAPSATVADKTISLPRADLLPLRGGGRALRRRPAARASSRARRRSR